MKVGPVVPGIRVLRLAAVFLLLPIGQAHAVGWESELVLAEDPHAVGASVLDPEALGGGAEPLQFDQSPTASVPIATPARAPTIPEHGVPTESSQGWTGLTESFTPASGSDCGSYPCRTSHHSANWSFRADALILWRNAPGSRPLYSIIDPATDTLGPTVLDANNLNSDVLAAPRLSLFRTNCDGQTLEATYLYAGNFYSERGLAYSPDGYATTPPGFYGNEWGPPNTSLDSAAAKLLGQLQSLEFNARHCIWPNTCQFLIGARWLQWNETLQMADSFSHAGDPSPTFGSDFYQTNCFNNLWGGQIGLDALVLGSPGMTRVEGLVKAGAYYTHAGQISSFRYTQSDGFGYDNQARADGPASCSFVGEVGLTAVLPITCYCDFRCGYYGLWLTGLAQPTRQLSNQTINQFDAVPALDTAGTVILQGLSLGIESRW